MAKIDMKKLKNLAIGVSGIYSLYFLGSVMQQRMMKVPYENIYTGEKQFFQSSNAFILIPSLLCWFIGYIYNTYIVQNLQISVPARNWFMTSAIVLAGTLTMTKAIYLTSYPLVTLLKSCNLLSVITVGIFFSRVMEKNQKLQKKKLIVGFLITIGILLFKLSKGESKQYSGDYVGIILLIISVIFDGLLPDFQAQIKSKHSPTAMQMFQHLNKWKSLLSLLCSLYSYEFLYMYQFFVNHPISFLHMMGLILTNALGQIVIYWMITCFRQHVVPFVITTRKIFTVGISILYFRHDVTWVQILGIIIVFMIVSYDFIDELTVKQIITNKSQNHIKIEQNDEGNQELKYVENLQNENFNKSSQNLQQ